MVARKKQNGSGPNKPNGSGPNGPNGANGVQPPTPGPSPQQRARFSDSGVSKSVNNPQNNANNKKECIDYAVKLEEEWSNILKIIEYSNSLVDDINKTLDHPQLHMVLVPFLFIPAENGTTKQVDKAVANGTTKQVGGGFWDFFFGCINANHAKNCIAPIKKNVAAQVIPEERLETERIFVQPINMHVNPLYKPIPDEANIEHYNDEPVDEGLSKADEAFAVRKAHRSAFVRFHEQIERLDQLELVLDVNARKIKEAVNSSDKHEELIEKLKNYCTKRMEELIKPETYMPAGAVEDKEHKIYNTIYIEAYIVYLCEMVIELSRLIKKYNITAEGIYSIIPCNIEIKNLGYYDVIFAVNIQINTDTFIVIYINKQRNACIYIKNIDKEYILTESSLSYLDTLKNVLTPNEMKMEMKMEIKPNFMPMQLPKDLITGMKLNIFDDVFKDLFNKDMIPDIDMNGIKAQYYRYKNVYYEYDMIALKQIKRDEIEEVLEDEKKKMEHKNNMELDNIAEMDNECCILLTPLFLGDLISKLVILKNKE